MSEADIEDALHPRMVGSTEGMTLQVLAQIRDSLTTLTRDMRDSKEATTDVRERVIRLEERDRRLDDIEGHVKILDGRVDVLMRDKDNRDGASGFASKIPGWVTFVIALASAFSALYLAGRSAGIVPAPPAAAAHVEATIQPDDRTITGRVGGKP